MSSVASETRFPRPAAGRLASRFLWKESRRLLGLALGVTGITLAVMLLLLAIGPYRDLAERLLIVAFGGAAMMAVAAAVTLFSVEEEEGTAFLLRTLPRHPFAGPLGKIVAAVVAVAAVAAVLCFAAGGIAGSWPDRPSLIWSQGPIAIGEAFVWTLLASLLVKKPLVAAVLGMAAASFNFTTVIGLLTSARHASSNELVNATPARVAFIAILMVIDVWLATRWFNIRDDRRVTRDGKNTASKTDWRRWGKAAVVIGLVAPLSIALLEVVSALIARQNLRSPDAIALAVSLVTAWAGVVVAKNWRIETVAEPASSRSRRAAFLRLLWQSLRQSWGVSLAVLIGGAFLALAYALVFRLFVGWSSSWTWACCFGVLFPPALLGAVVFRADQRGERHRFLAEHAGRPRLLWLARLITGVAPIAVFAVLYWEATGRFALMLLTDNVSSPRWWSGQTANWVEVLGDQLLVDQEAWMALHVSWVIVLAALVAFAWGQFFSLAIRSEIFAGMLAMLASVVVAAWAMVVGIWRLSPTWFLAPLAAGALAATWLRAPDWMFGRRGVVRWAGPALAFALPIAGVLLSTPAARRAQLAAVPLESGSPLGLTVPVRDPVTSARLAKFDALYGNRLLDGDEVVSFATFARRAEAQKQTGRDVADDYERLAQRVEEAGRMTDDLFAEFADLTRKKCRLPVEFSRSGTRFRVITRLVGEALKSPEVIGGIDADPLELEGSSGRISLSQRLDRLMACRRVAAQQENGRQFPSYVGDRSPWLLSDELLAWATADGQTPERLRQAIEELEAIENLGVGASGLLMNRYLHARAVVRGEESPSFLQASDERKAKPSSEEWLSYLANELPGEAERAERALGTLALERARYLMWKELNLTRDTEWFGKNPHRGTQPTRWHRPLNPAMMIVSATPRSDLVPRKLSWYRQAETSHLARREFGEEWSIDRLRREWATAYAWRRAERVRLALVAYRLENEAYPERLDQLTPEFLRPDEYRDPFSDGPLGYRREGFDIPTAGRTIRAGTPILWSGGPTAAQPIEALAYRELVDGSSQEVIVREGRETPDGVETYPVVQLGDGWYNETFWMHLPR